MDVENQDKKQMRPEERDDAWFHTASYKFRRMQWASPYPGDCEDATYGQSLQSPLLPPSAVADPVSPVQPEAGTAMEVEVKK